MVNSHRSLVEMSEVASLVYRCRNPLKLPADHDPVSVLPRLVLELQIIQQHEDVGLVEEIEVAEPGQEGRLHANTDHRATPRVGCP